MQTNSDLHKASSETHGTKFITVCLGTVAGLIQPRRLQVDSGLLNLLLGFFMKYTLVDQ